MSTKKTKEIKVINEMPKFKRTTRTGVGTAKVEKKKMHTSTRVVVKKEHIEVNKLYIKTLKEERKIINKLAIKTDKQYESTLKAIERFNNHNTKENAKSLINSLIKLKECFYLMDQHVDIDFSTYEKIKNLIN